MKKNRYGIGRRVVRGLTCGAVAWLLLWPGVCAAAPLSLDDALERMVLWMESHPVMRQAAGRALDWAVVFPSDEAAYAVYVVSLHPRGYVVLNSDDRLPVAVAFSADSMVSLADVPDNAFRAMLISFTERMAQEIGTLPEKEEVLFRPFTESVVYGPYLETSWNQNHPYNLFCPDDPDGDEYYGYRAPTGCVPTAYAQVLYYHRWPLYGHGSHSYHDTDGSITGYHAVVFSDPFGWSAMQPAYSAWEAEQEGDIEVADLMYRLGVAGEVDYENRGTSACTDNLGQRISAQLYFEQVETYHSQAALLPAMRQDIQSGLPVVASIPGHAVVADGHLEDGLDEVFHINYGWGGENNGWFTADRVPNGAIWRGVTSIRPQLLAIPVERERTFLLGEEVELEWVLPVRRESEAARLRIQRLMEQAGTWSSDASDFSHALSSGWEVRPGEGRTGACWYAGPIGYASLILTDRFVPTAATSLNFWMKYQLDTATFSVSVSEDGGETYATLFERNEAYQHSFSLHSVPLGAYAGKEIRIRFELQHSESFYPGGGVWLDDLTISSGDWLRWEPFAEDDELASRRFAEQRTLLDDCADFSVFEVTSTSSFKDWVVDPDGVFYKEPGGYSNHQYHLTSRSTVTPDETTRLLLRWKRDLNQDRFRILVSSNRSTFTEIWSAGGGSDWIETAISLAEYAGQSIYLRLEYVGGSFYSDGGVWIDTIWLQEVDYPELEGQPVHYTMLGDLPAGSYTLAAVLEDGDEVLHPLGPPLHLSILSLFDVREEGDGSITITRWNGSDLRVEVPAQIDDRPVRAIAADAFDGASVVRVFLPAGLETLEAGAFAGAVELERLYFRGDAPWAGDNLFPDSNPAIYVLSGTGGWGDTFSGQTVALWNPVIQGTSGVTPEGFRIVFTGPAEDAAVIEIRDELTSGGWTAVQTNRLDGGEGAFTDAGWAGQATRYYRIRWSE